MSEESRQSNVDEEIAMLEVHIGDWQPQFWQAERTFRTGKAYLERLAILLCAKFGSDLPVKRCAVEFTFPQGKEDTSTVEDWRDKKAFEALPPEFKPLSGETVVCVVQIHDRHFLNLIAFSKDGERPLFTFREDSPNSVNWPPTREWSFHNRSQDDWDPKLKSMSELRLKSDLYQLWSAISLLRLINSRATDSEAARATRSYFDIRDPRIQFVPRPTPAQ